MDNELNVSRILKTFGNGDECTGKELLNALVEAIEISRKQNLWTGYSPLVGYRVVLEKFYEFEEDRILNPIKNDGDKCVAVIATLIRFYNREWMANETLR